MTYLFYHNCSYHLYSIQKLEKTHREKISMDCTVEQILSHLCSFRRNKEEITYINEKKAGTTKKNLKMDERITMSSGWWL